MTLGAALVLVLFVLTCGPGFVLLPVALLLLTGPIRLPQLAWIVAGSAWTLMWYLTPEPLSEQVIKGWSAISAGFFFLLALRPRWRAIDAAILSLLFGALSIGAWMVAYRVSADAIVVDSMRVTMFKLRYSMDRSPELRPFLGRMADLAPDAARLFPFSVLVPGICGLVLAWRWYHILSPLPLGVEPSPFPRFTFSDHFIWLLVLGMAGTVAQVTSLLPTGQLWPLNLLAFVGALYVVRGTAILTGLTPAPPYTLLLWLTLGILFRYMAPLVIAGLLGIGISDTWLDFRRRLAAAQGE